MLTPNSNVELAGLSDSNVLHFKNNDKLTNEMQPNSSPSATGSMGSIYSFTEEGKMTSPKKAASCNGSGGKKAVLKKSPQKTKEMTLFVPAEESDSWASDEESKRA